MTKNEFVTKMTKKVDGLTKKDAAIMLDTIAEVITETLVSGDDATIPGIGKFSVKDVPEKTGTIQLGEKKGEQYVSPAHRKAVFKVATALRDAVK